MSRFRDWKLECKVYVGDLGNSTEKEDLERLFEDFGPLRNVWVARSPPGFAFVEFENKKDAEDAAAELDGTRFKGKTIRVEMSTGRPRDKRRGGRGAYYGGGGGSRSYGRDSGSRRYSGERYRRSRSRSPRRDHRSRSRSVDRHRSNTPN